jgi:T5SS/PEP-CTERM-associated repeat protein
MDLVIIICQDLSFIMRASYGGPQGNLSFNLESSLLGLFVAFVLVMLVPSAFAQAFTVTVEAPRVQDSALSMNPSGFGASNVTVESFQELKAGFISKSAAFAGNIALGSYDHLLVRSADALGGAGGKGTYMSVNSSSNAASNPTTLTLAKPQQYFGLWWSAGGPNNVLSFYSGSKLLETFKTDDVVNFINKQANKNAYYGNPNNGKSKGKPYAFLNFYADPSNPNLTFDRIVFSNLPGGGFEQDNHTIASIYTEISGMDINPATRVDLGSDPGSIDTKGVKGPDSTLTDSGTAIIGESGNGALNVIDGGKVTAGGIEIGQNHGSTGEVTVNGNGSSLSDVGNAVIGDGGKGQLDITNGGTFNDTNATLGNQPGSSGTVIVDGTGSEWKNSGTLDVGPIGSGVLDIADGAAVTADNGTMVGPNGIIMGDGTITTPTLTNEGTVMPTGPNGTPGILSENGNYRQAPTGILHIGVGGKQPSRSDELLINGNAKLDGALALASLNNFRATSGTTFEILHATNGVTGNFSRVVGHIEYTGVNPSGDSGAERCRYKLFSSRYCAIDSHDFNSSAVNFD